MNKKRFNRDMDHEKFMTCLTDALREIQGLDYDALEYILIELRQDSIGLAVELLKNKVNPLLENMGWDELRKQKLTVQELATDERLTLEERENMSGILHALDGFMDAAASQLSKETVFGDQSEEANRLREKGELV